MGNVTKRGHTEFFLMEVYQIWKHHKANYFKLVIFAKMVDLLLSEIVIKDLTFNKIEKTKQISGSLHQNWVLLKCIFSPEKLPG